MKVRELRDRHAGRDPDREIFCYFDDDALLPKGHLFRILDIEGEKLRGSDELTSVKFGKSVYSHKYATIEILSDF